MTAASLSARDQVAGTIRLVLMLPVALLDRIDAARGTDPLEEWIEDAVKQRLRRGS